MGPAPDLEAEAVERGSPAKVEHKAFVVVMPSINLLRFVESWV